MKHSEMKKFVQDLNTEEKAQIVGILLNNSPDLTKKIYDTAMEVVIGVEAGEIEDDVYYELDMLDLDEMNSRSGRTQYGYVEPYEAAWEMFEEALSAFIEEMKKNQKRALHTVAKTHCIGIVKGLLRYDRESSSDFKDWVTDAPGEYVDMVVEDWKKGNPSDEDIAEVMNFVKDGKQK